MEPSKNKFNYKPLLLTLFLATLITALAWKFSKPTSMFKPFDTTSSSIKKFTSEQNFKDYIEKSQSQQTSFFGMGIGLNRDFQALEESVMPSADTNALGTPAGLKNQTNPDRFSTTNVQVMGIDEPDIVKTNGQQIFYSFNNPIYFFGEPGRPVPLIQDKVLMESENNFVAPDNSGSNQILPYPESQASTSIINAFPPTALNKLKDITENGQLLLQDKNLIILTNEGLSAYDVSNPNSPNHLWKLKYNQNHYLNTARLFNGKIYLVTQTYVNSSQPCPLKPLVLLNNEPSSNSESSKQEMVIPCTEIYYPGTPIPVDSTFTAMAINPTNGQVLQQTTFVGTANNSVIYISPQALYVTYTYFADPSQTMAGFFAQSGQKLLPQNLIDRINKLKTYELSSEAQLTELQAIINKHMNSLTKDEQLKFNNELQNLATDYLTNHQREIQTTGIIKIELEKFEIEASGNVPGQPLNQFSLDEYQSHLRIATTIEAGFFGFGFGGRQSNANDVYILNQKLKTVGSVTNLGLTERIFSARFVEDRGYLVTFRQTDPFYVLDLSNPDNPQMKGELKIPGFSSYLHPLNKHLILGVGQENNQVKLSLFDVANPQNPIEADKYLLNEYWTGVQETHHAFLQDSKHQIFFVPAGNAGYILSYANNQIQLLRAITDSNLQNVKRAMFIDDYLYIISEKQIIVLNETDWKEINRLDL